MLGYDGGFQRPCPGQRDWFGSQRLGGGHRRDRVSWNGQGYVTAAHQFICRYLNKGLARDTGNHQDWLFRDTDWNWRLVPEEGGALRAVGDIGSHWIDLTSSITGLRVTEVLADLVTFIPIRRKPAGPVALGAPPDGGRLLLIMPWHGRALIGTSHSDQPADAGDPSSRR